VWGGGVRLLHWKVSIVTTPVETLRVGPTAREIFLIDTVSERVWYSTNNGSSHFTGRHLSQLYRGCLAVESCVRGHDQIGRVFQGGIA